MTDTSVVNLIIDSVNADLVLNLQTLVAQGDATKAFLVRPGLLQADPTPGINVLTHVNDPEDEKSWENAVVSGPGSDLRTLVSNYPYEIGEGELWYRRFTTELIQFWKPGFSRDDARRFSNVVLSRAEHTIKHSISGLGPDSFGEVSLAFYIASSRNSEGGGPGQFAWYGRIRWQALTGKV